MIKKIFPIAICVLICAEIVAQDKVLYSVDLARNSLSNAYTNFNKSFASMNSANAIQENATNETYNQFHIFSIHKNKVQNLTPYMDTQKLEIEKFISNFEEVCKRLESAKINLDALKKILPVGKKRIELAKEIINKTRDIVTKNPGENYQDKKYFDAVNNTFIRAKNQMDETQKDIEKIALEIAVCKPRVDGIKIAIKSLLDFSGKSQTSALDCAKLMSNIKPQMEALIKGVQESGRNINQKYDNLNKIHENMVAIELDLNKLILNDLPENKKYYNVVFKPLSLSIIIPQGNPVINSTMSKREYGKSMLANLNESSAQEFSTDSQSVSSNMNFTMPKERITSKGNLLGASISSATGQHLMGDTLSAKDDVRKEVLGLCSDLYNLSVELSTADSNMQNIVSEAYRAIDDVRICENNAQILLRNAMQKYFDIQSIFSELSMFSNSIEILKSRKLISDKELENLMQTQIKNSMDELKKDLSETSKYINEARKELK